MTSSHHLLLLHARALPPRDIIDNEPEFEPQRAALARLDATEDAFDERERARYAKHEKALKAWAARAEGAALAGDEPPTDRPVWEATPGRAAFDREREAEVERIRKTWQAHGREIVDRLTAAAKAERATAQAERDEASRAERAAADRLHVIGNRLTMLRTAGASLPRPEPRRESGQDDGLLHPAGRYAPAVALGEIWSRR